MQQPRFEQDRPVFAIWNSLLRARLRRYSGRIRPVESGFPGDLVTEHQTSPVRSEICCTGCDPEIQADFTVIGVQGYGQGRVEALERPALDQDPIADDVRKGRPGFAGQSGV